MSLSPNDIPSPISIYREKFGLKRGSSLRISSNTLQCYHEAFSVIDKENKGAIGSEQINNLLRKLGKNPTQEQVEDILKLDPKNTNTISFENFCRVMSAQMDSQEKEEELSEVFKAFDLDNDGWINVQEMKKTLSNVFGESLDDLEDLLQLETDKINFDTFKSLMGSQK